MAATTILTRPVNGVSWAVARTLTSTDVSNGAIIFDFQTDRNLIAMYTLVSSVGAVVLQTATTAITTPAAGQVEITKGSETWTAGDILYVIASTYRAV